MNFPQSVSTCLKKYFDFTGRASRSEFWYFFLFYIITSFLVGWVIGSFVALLGGSVNVLLVVLSVVFIALFIPILSVTVRRFHDFGVSGWMYCAFIVPYVISGFIEDAQPVLALIIDIGTLVIFLVYASKEPNKGKNKFGSVPKK